MPKEKNAPIGDVACPHRTCDEKASVFKFRTRAKETWAQRRAGKLYSACPAGHRCEDQDYLLENATIWGAEKSGDSAPAADRSAPVKNAEKPVSAPVQAAPERTSPAPAKQGMSESSDSLSKGSKSTNGQSNLGWGWFR